MKTITTCTIASQDEMKAAIVSGLTVALHLESQDRPSGMAIFCKTVEDARRAFRQFAKGWEQFMVCEYPTADLSDHKQISSGWV